MPPSAGTRLLCSLLQRARLGFRCADDRLQAEQDLAFLGIAAELAIRPLMSAK